jgi:hypothetical protein
VGAGEEEAEVADSAGAGEEVPGGAEDSKLASAAGSVEAEVLRDCGEIDR